MRNFFLLFSLIFFLRSTSQIAITEVNYDTPYLEDLYHYANSGLDNPTPFLHHLGEFIELYNYSTEDIPLDGWSIVDHVSSFTFPQGTVIKTNEFLVVAYRPSNYSVDYFTSYFPSTVGKEDHIIYQDEILLRNEREDVKLKMGMLRGLHFSNVTVSSMIWDFHGNITNPIDNGYNPDCYSTNINYYLPSLQMGQQQNVIDTANPLSADYVPPTKKIEEMSNVTNLIADNLAEMTWSFYADLILSNTCMDNIPIVEQIAATPSNIEGKCFTYDESGNIATSEDCDNPTVAQNGSSSEYSSEELDEISSKISLAPNPTSGWVTVTWDGSIQGEIIQLQVTSISGAPVVILDIANNQTSVGFDLSGFPTGIYISSFLLDTGQPVTKNVLKI